MRPLLSISLLAALALFSTCKRLDHDTLCEGTVVDRHTGTRVPNATIEVYQASGGLGGSLGGGFGLRETHQADANGDFAFQINDDSEDLRLKASTPQGHQTRWDEAPYLRGGRNNKKLQLRVQAPAWLRVRVLDVPPLSPAASISFGGTLPIPTGFALSESGDDTVVLSLDGNTETTLYWKLIGGFVYETGDLKVYCAGVDTTDLQITY